jgi:hypothetical protein
MGQALGVAISGALLNTNLHGPIRTEFASASRPAWLLLTGCGCTVLVLGLTTTRPLPSQEVLPRAASGLPKTFQDLGPPAEDPEPPAEDLELPAEDLEPPAKPVWVPRDPVTQPSGYPGASSGNPSVLTRRDQVYYRRQWRAGDGQDADTP